MKVKTKVDTRFKSKSKSKFKTDDKKKELRYPLRKRTCRFCTDKTRVIDYKDVKRMESFITERGKIVSTRFSGNCAKHQRRIAEAVKMARFLSLLPYLR